MQSISAIKVWGTDKHDNPFFKSDQIYGRLIPTSLAGLRKVYPYYFTFTTFTKGRWVGEKILDVFAREFRAHPVEEYVGVLPSLERELI